ncbi:hypothetical protein, partial [Marivita cryptomonadis]|uniref:hypothetical protein n=2 Tax=Marivita TaxID=659428 RepID=UPI001EEF61A8
CTSMAVLLQKNHHTTDQRPPYFAHSLSSQILGQRDSWMAHPVVRKSATATIIFCLSIKTCIEFPFFSVFLRIGFSCLTP